DMLKLIAHIRARLQPALGERAFPETVCQQQNGSPDTGDGDRALLRKALKAEAPVIFFINGIGDNILNLPALRALGALFAGRSSLICSGSALFMFDDL